MYYLENNGRYFVTYENDGVEWAAEKENATILTFKRAERLQRMIPRLYSKDVQPGGLIMVFVGKAIATPKSE